MLCALPAGAHADGWRCGVKLITTGDFIADVRAACGEPAAVERRTQMRSLRDLKGREHTKISNIEEWSYRKDSTELLRTLVFEDGRLIAIRIGGRAPTDSSRCERQLFARGTSSAEVLLACGEPTSRDQWVEIIQEEVAEGTLVGRSITRERWVYNFGPDRFLRIFELANGRLVDQKTGGYGFAASQP